MGLHVKQSAEKDSTDLVHYSVTNAESPNRLDSGPGLVTCWLSTTYDYLRKSLHINDLGRPDFRKSLTVNDLGKHTGAKETASGGAVTLCFFG
jgi:hypothetical protein